MKQRDTSALIEYFKLLTYTKLKLFILILGFFFSTHSFAGNPFTAQTETTYDCSCPSEDGGAIWISVHILASPAEVIQEIIQACQNPIITVNEPLELRNSMAFSIIGGFTNENKQFIENISCYSRTQIW